MYILLSCVQVGGSPLYGASAYGHTAVVDILIEAGADVHQANFVVCMTIITCISPYCLLYLSASFCSSYIIYNTNMHVWKLAMMVVSVLIPTRASCINN